jgi:hypothetical protein
MYGVFVNVSLSTASIPYVPFVTDILFDKTVLSGEEIKMNPAYGLWMKTQNILQSAH